VGDSITSSTAPPPSPPAPLPQGERGEVVLIDTLGELMDFYAASDVAFVGGSLVAHGGHNPLEPAALGLPVITGSHVLNFAEVYEAMMSADAARKIEDTGALGSAVATLLTDAVICQRMGEAGKVWITTHRGVLGRLMRRLEGLG